jgi:hypothetical protein
MVFVGNIDHVDTLVKTSHLFAPFPEADDFRHANHAARVTFWGAFAMALTAGIGKVVGAVV